MTAERTRGERVPEGEFGVLVRSGVALVRYRGTGGRLCAAVAEGAPLRWLPCPPPVRLAFADGDVTRFVIVAPGVDYAINGFEDGDNAFFGLSAHAGTLGIPGTLVAVLDATPTMAGVAEALGFGSGRRCTGPLLDSVRRDVARGHMFATGEPMPFGLGYADPLSLRAVRAWLRDCLDGVAWDDVPAWERHFVAGAEHWLSRLGEDAGLYHLASDVAGNAREKLLLMTEVPCGRSSPLELRLSSWAGRWCSLREATDIAVTAR